ncbi:MAG TPA: GNAT family N-acetyltransferase [Ktedonobacteraceae bacterium]|jgi:RimJ/RimL family protein N-acetyltransferase
MFLDDRTLLRLHVEAVWGVQLPPVAGLDLTLLPESARPDWRLYAAGIAGSTIAIWRPDVPTAERAELLARLCEIGSLPPDDVLPPGIDHEVALRLAVEPTMALAVAWRIARVLTPADRALLEQFEPDSAAYYLQEERRPLIGVVVAGQLVSVAHSSRRTAQACELGIHTLAQARRRGYALAATIVWSTALRQEGLVPIYSALAENTASLKLARAAGYREFAHALTLV